MIRTYVSDGKGPTKEQIEEVEKAANSPIVFDEDCPEISPNMEKALRSAAIQRNRRNKRKNA